jgi:putative Ca2+/H+ antiporter (TMEM165/GDT1 family)
MIDVSKKKVIILQTIAIGIALAKIILIPLGIFLSDIISEELVISIAGVFFLISIIPLMLLKR